MPEFLDIPSPGWPLDFGEPGRPGVVLVHDDYGRLPYLEAYARALAGQGFRVLLPDLFDGRATVDSDGAAELVAGADPGFAAATVDDAIGMARGEGATRVGLAGLGFGGRLALLAAQSGAADAVVAYDAVLGEGEAGLIPCPVLLHRARRAAGGGSAGRGDSSGEQDVFVSRLKENGTPVTVHGYESASPGFANATVLRLLDKNAAALAFARTTYFLQAQLLD